MIAALAAVIWAGSRDRDADRPHGVAADEVFLDRADRHDDLVVGIWKPVPPLGWRMPMTRNGRPPTEICVPRSLAVRPRFVAVVAPRTATRRSCSRLASVRNEPCQTS